MGCDGENDVHKGRANNKDKMRTPSVLREVKEENGGTLKEKKKKKKKKGGSRIANKGLKVIRFVRRIAYAWDDPIGTDTSAKKK